MVHINLDNAAKSMPPVPAPKNTLNSVPNKHMLRPYFEDVGSRNLTAVVGQVVILKCRVKQLGERTVSDYQLLNYGFDARH
ncbi:hypothetical protein M8J77_014541 [Diaphorina citri]|nr:hypothetical protein M8J77_014541 [Diaphorina citri]